MISNVHTCLGYISLISGLIVLIRPKGTVFHIVAGRIYVLCMLGLNLTALAIYELFGRFGIFHWFALFSLLTIILGFMGIALRSRIKNGVYFHYYFMTWSYIGLLCATINEIYVHVPFANNLRLSNPWLPWTTIGLLCFAALLIIPALEKRVIFNAAISKDSKHLMA